MKENLSLPWGTGTIKLEIPDNWRIKGIMEPTSLPPVEAPVAEVMRAMQEPIGCGKLADLVSPGWKIAIVIDDISRPTPVPTIFPVVLKELLSAGIKREEITVVTALGLHRDMEPDEIMKRCGLEAFDGINWENHRTDDLDKLANLGTTSRNTPVLFNKTVASADLIVSIGCIEPHIIASFGGGYKNLLPGVAGRASIANNHGLNCSPSTFNMVGQPIENNPMRMDLEEAGRMLKPAVFIVNAILDNRQRLIQIVAGDPILAHRAGVRVSSNLYGVKIPGPADVVITDSHPMNSDLRQGVKALANTVRALKPGGVLITLVKAEEGVGVFGLANKKLPVGRNALKLLAPVLLPLVPRLKLKGMGEEDKFFLYFALQAMQLGTLLLYAPTIPVEIHERLPFVKFVSSPDEGVAQAAKRFKNGADVLVFPSGGITYPQIL